MPEHSGTYLYRGGHAQANHIEMVFDKNIDDVLSSTLSLEIGLLETDDCLKIDEFIKNNDPLGDAFWIKLHNMSEAKFKSVLHR